MSKIELEDRGRALEDKFFHDQQTKLLEALHAKKDRNEAIAALSAASGVSDEAVLGDLVDVGVSAASLTAFALVPLGVVAWADGTLKPAERAAVLEAAADRGINPGSPARSFLEDLLKAAPAPVLMQHWEHFVASLRKEVGDAGFAAIAGDISGRARAVAEAAGGILGLHAVSQAESDVLARIEAALH